MQKLLLSFLLILGLGNTLLAQVEGLWEVRLVKVGEQTPTPTAKWFDMKAGGALLSGNGGNINQRGSWAYEDEQLLFSSPDGSADPAGVFKVSWNDDEMIWSRSEEGMEVKISLGKIQNLPMAPWDYLPGNWQIQHIIVGGKEMIEDKDPERKFQIFFRWDNLFIAKNDLQGRGQHWGAWQLHSHNRKLRLFDLDGDSTETWMLESIDDQTMVWTQDDRKWVFERK